VVDSPKHQASLHLFVERSAPTATENGILQQVASGVERAMETCISQYGGLVWSIALRYVRDRSSAEDLVQETFTDLWKSSKRYNPAIATECTFIGMLARRRAIDFARKQNRQPTLEPLPDAESLPLESSDPSAAVRCESSDVREALRHLPEESQTIFSLHFDQGMTHPEIVKKTGLPLGTVKTRLRRGLIEVRNILRRLEGDGEPSTSPTS
jgi:RNA polymerase sigma factor (sigma-70 family)